MASATMEKTAEELRKEIAELQRQQWEITERLRNPRGLRRAGAGAGGPRLRGVIRPAPELEEEQPVSKRRLSSAVVKVDGEGSKDDGAEGEDPKVQDPAVEVGVSSGGEISRLSYASGQINGGFRRDGNVRLKKMDYDAIPTETVPRVLPKEDDPNLVKRNRRMLGQLLGTLEKFREEDKQLSSTEAYMRRSDSLKRAEQKAREESERLRQQEREQISEKRRRDLTLRARVAAKAEEKKLELLFLFWAEHHKKLSNFLRTKAEPPIYYMPVKPLVEDAALQGQHKEQAFQEWKSLRRAELSEYQKQIEENYISNVERELERWKNARRSNNLVNLQESMDKELETHRLEHGPKPRRISGSNDEDEDIEDIIVEDELMDEVLDQHDRPEADAAKIPEAAADDVSLVVVLLDVNPFFWAAGAGVGGGSHPTATLPFAKFLNHVIPFLNSLLLLNQLNQVVIIASGINSCGYVYDSGNSGPDGSDKVPEVSSEILRKLEEFFYKDRKIGKDTERAMGSSVSSLLSGSLSLALCCILNHCVW